MIKEFLGDYGPLLSLAIITIGWYVIFNTSNYIASRNEAKSIVNELTKLFESSFSDSINFWSLTFCLDKANNQSVYEKNILIIKQIKVYRTLLNKYNVNTFTSEQLIEIKKVLTLSPNEIERSNKDRYKTFCNERIKYSQRLCSKSVYQVHNSFISRYQPVNKPILHSFNINFLKSPAIQGLAYGLILIALYFGIGNWIIHL